MNKYYYSPDGPTHLIIKENGTYNALLFADNILSQLANFYTFKKLTFNIIIKYGWCKRMSPHYKYHLKLALEEMANDTI